MRSIYEQALGDKFKLLHPRIQERFGFSSKDRGGSVGRGVMEKVWRGKFFTLPFSMSVAGDALCFPSKAATSHSPSGTTPMLTHSVGRRSRGFAILRPGLPDDLMLI